MISLCVKSNNQELLGEIKHRLCSFNCSELCFRKHSFKIFDNIIIHYNGENIDEFYDFLSKTLAEVIVVFFEPSLIRRLIDLNYFYFNIEDKNIIIDEYELIKQKNLYDRAYVESIVSSAIYEYIIDNKSIVLTGFVNFRLPEYYEYLESIVAEAVNQYIIDKEYISFVNLLRSYVDSKIPNDINVNLIYINSKGILLSDDGEYIELDSFNSAYVSDISFSQNDYILNTLVGLLPNEIKVHLVSPKDQFIKTIEMIFTDKVNICKGCELCKTYKLLQLK